MNVSVNFCGKGRRLATLNAWRRFFACALLLLLPAAGIAVPAPASAAPAEPVRGMLMPRVSPDGEWIAVSYQGMIARVRSTGGPLIALTHGEGWDGDPAWSPDGTRLAYINSPIDGPRQLQHLSGTLRMLSVVDGAEISLPTEIHAAGPLWFDRDGRRLLGRFGPGPAARLGWLNLDTGTVTAIGFGDVEGRIDPRRPAPYALADDAESIYFAAHQDAPGEQTGNNGPFAELRRIAASGGAAERVLRFGARLYDLSPDGRNRGLYAVTNLGTSHEDIWHLPFAAAEAGARKLTFSQADESAPSASRGGGPLVHTENSNVATDLVRRNVETGIAETVRISHVEFGRPTGRLELKLVDRDDPAPVARVSIKRIGGKFHAPVAATHRIAAGLGYFYARSGTRLVLPAGRYELKAFRGPEYRMQQREFEITPGGAQKISVHLERWINAAGRGWYSGENHIHANYGHGAWYVTPAEIFEQCAGEDLRVGNIVVANSDGEGVFDREFFTGRPHPLSTSRQILYWNQEFRSTLWGHMTLFNLSRLVEPLFTGFRDTTNPWDIPTNADIAARTSAQGGKVSYTHPMNTTQDILQHVTAARGLPVDVALGRIDTIDVMGAVYQSTLPVWYHVLNCGFRIPAAAGTDCFLNRVHVVLPGWGRAYVYIPDGLDYDKWVAGLTAGRSFVSNGPFLEFTVADKTMGDTLALPGPAKVRIRGRAEAQFPLQALELVYNGKVAAAGTLSADKLSAAFDQEIEIGRSGWVALRASGPPVRNWHGPERGAHTSPVYLEVRDRPLDRTASARYFLQWIDTLEDMLKQRNRLHTGEAHVAAQLEEAREVYRRMLWQEGR